MNQEAFIIINNHNPIGKRRRKRSGLRFVSGFPAQASSSLAPPHEALHSRRFTKLVLLRCLCSNRRYKYLPSFRYVYLSNFLHVVHTIFMICICYPTVVHILLMI
ncbi:hypothetical protein LINPERPRIM_LOCUS26473, partial [Linum perenne]